MSSRKLGKAIGEADLIQPSRDVVVQRMGSEIVIVHLRTDRIYELNRTAARVWELLGTGCSRAQLERRMREEFDVEPDRLAQEMDDLLESMRQTRLIRVS